MKGSPIVLRATYQRRRVLWRRIEDMGARQPKECRHPGRQLRGIGQPGLPGHGQPLRRRKAPFHHRPRHLIASQLPVASWYEVIGESTIADAILHRLIHGAHRIELKGSSMRKKENSRFTHQLFARRKRPPRGKGPQVVSMPRNGGQYRRNKHFSLGRTEGAR